MYAIDIVTFHESYIFFVSKRGFNLKPWHLEWFIEVAK